MNINEYSFNGCGLYDEGGVKALVDVSKLAKDAGFTVPVFVTRDIWCFYVSVSEDPDDKKGEKGRLWMILINADPRKWYNLGKSEYKFEFEVFLPTEIWDDEPMLASLKAVVRRFQDGSPYLTIQAASDDQEHDAPPVSGLPEGENTSGEVGPRSTWVNKIPDGVFGFLALLATAYFAFRS